MKTESKKREKNYRKSGWNHLCLFVYNRDKKEFKVNKAGGVRSSTQVLCCVWCDQYVCQRARYARVEGEKWKFIISEKRKIIGVLTAFHYYRESLEQRMKNAEAHSRCRPPTGLNRMLMNNISKSKKERERNIPLRIKVDGQIKLYNIHNNSIGRTATKARQLNLAPHYSIRALVYTMCDNIVVPRR